MKTTLLIALTVLPFFSNCSLLGKRQTTQSSIRCGNEDIATPKSLVDTYTGLSNGSIVPSAPHAEATVIETYFHAVAAPGMEGLITQDQLNQQLAVLNDRFEPSGYQFRLVNISFTIQKEWADGWRPEWDAAMKARLRNGGYDALNVYFQTNFFATAPPELKRIGQCDYARVLGPTPYPRQAYSFDGCGILATTLPGGSLAPYNLGTVTVHEVSSHGLSTTLPLRYTC
jgi:hypothetical protein